MSQEYPLHFQSQPELLAWITSNAEFVFHTLHQSEFFRRVATQSTPDETHHHHEALKHLQAQHCIEMSKAAQQIEELSREAKRFEETASKLKIQLCAQNSRFKEKQGYQSALCRHVRNSQAIGTTYIAAESISTYLKQPGLENIIEEKCHYRTQPLFSAYYVSQQFIDFVKNGNFGNGIALFFNGVIDHETHRMIGSDKPRETKNTTACLEAVAKDLGEDTDYVAKEMGVSRDLALRYADPRHLLRPLIVSQSGTYPLLVSIFERYIRVNNLEVGDDSSRVRVDKNMKRWFGPGTNTHHIVLRTDNITKYDVTRPEFLTDPDHDVHKNALELLAIHGGTSAYDGETFSRTMIYKLISTFVIPKVPASVLPEPSKDMAHICAGVRIYITS